MIYFLKNIILTGVFLSNIITLSFSQDIGSLNDSMVKYKKSDYQKAFEYGFEALDSFQEEDDISLDIVNTYYYLGEIFFFLGNYKTSFEYLSKSLELYELLSPIQRRNSDVIKPPWVLVIMGNVYYQNKDYENAEIFYYEALDNFRLFDLNYDEEKYFGVNTSLLNLALIKKDQGEFETALDLLDQVYERRVEFGKNLDILSSYVSYMELYLDIGNEEMFLDFFNMAKTSYESFISDTSYYDREYQLIYALANRNFAKYLKSKFRFQESLDYLLFAKQLLKDFPNEIPKVNYDISEIYFSLGMNERSKGLILENLNDEQTNQIQKLDNFKLLEKIYINEKSLENLLMVKDSIIYYSDKPINKLGEEEFNILENLLLISEKQNDLKLSKSRNNRNALVSIFLVAILFLTAVSFKFNFDLQKEKNTRLNLEKDKINEKLKLKKRELFSKVNFISQRNEYLNNIKNQLDGDIANNKNLKNLKREIKNITSSEQSYEEFDKMFSQVYPQFYKRLNKLAKLSQTDIRLASYIKMNHSNNEISRISGISLRTVESQRYRLTKKLKISSGEDLNTYILRI